MKLSVVAAACAVAAAAARQVLPERPTFKVTVDAVSIDAVVTDRKGAVVPDLTAADFEVLQNGKPQKVTFAQFVPVTSRTPLADSPMAPGVAPASPAMKAAGPVPPITRDHIGRTIILVVDDLGLSVQGINDTRLALRRFVDTQLLPTDLVAIVRTGESRGILQSLTTDRVVLGGAIDALRYNICSREGVLTSGGDVTQAGGPPAVAETGLQCMIPTTASLAALSVVVEAAREMPGRKTVIFISEGFGKAEFGTHPTTISGDDSLNVRDALDRAIDQATRSGVVIYALDGQGLQTGGLRASDSIYSADTTANPQAMSSMVRELGATRLREVRDAQDSLHYLAEQTGGFAVVNTNDLAGGLGRISDDVKGYYVIGYEPDQDTFRRKGKSARRHTIAVKVKRADVVVRTRKAFIGVSDPEPASRPPTPAETLVRAAMSPFHAATIALHATNLPGYSRERGMFVRTVLHLDARALTFQAAGHTKTATVDLVGLVFNTDGVQVHSISTGFDVALGTDAAAGPIGNGLAFTARVPIQEPGGYQLRYAVRDRRSGAMGSVGGFVNVPDVTGGAFALSGLVLRASDRAATSESIDSERFSVNPADALRVYAPGTRLTYSYEIYNPKASVQTMATLWRGTEKLTSTPPETLAPASDGGVLAASGRLDLPNDLPAGAYVLEIAATSSAKKARRAIQRVSLDVR